MKGWTTIKQRLGRNAARLQSLLLGAVLAGTACSAGPGSEQVPSVEANGSNSGESMDTTQRLSGGPDTHERCNTLAADLVWNGGGFVRTNANYTAHNGTNECWDAFLIDLNNYHRQYINGTRVTYGRVVPTDEAACRRTLVRGHFWRKNSDGTTLYLGTAQRFGRWITGSNVPPRCDVPNFVIERDVPGYTPGASYRLAVTARENRATTGYDRREIVIETEKPDLGLTPYQADKRISRLLNEASTQAGRGLVHASVQKLFNTRGSAVAGIDCRVAQLEVSALRLNLASLGQVGGGTAATSAFNAYDTMVRAFCGTGALTALQLQSQLIEYLAQGVQMKLNISTLLGMPDASTIELLSSVFGSDFARIMAGCGTSMVEFHDFIRTGAVPAGIAGPNVLLRNCSGSDSVLQARLGMTGVPATIRNSLQSCIVQAFDQPPIEQRPGACNDPRAAGAAGECPGSCHATPPSTDPCQQDPMSDACFEQRSRQTGFPAYNDGQVQAGTAARWLALNAYNEAKSNYTMSAERLNALTLSSAEMASIARKSNEFSFWASLASKAASQLEAHFELEPGASDYLRGASDVAEAVSKRSYSVGADDNAEAQRLEQALPRLADERERARQKLCQADPSNAECQKPSGVPADSTKRCPENDLGTGPVWFDHADGSRITVADRIANCSCEAMRRASFTLSGGGTSNLVCMTSQEKLAFDCQTNPWSPNDGQPNPLLRPECRNAFQPSGLDRDALLAGLCDKVRCADDQVAVAAFGRCACLTNPTPATLAATCNFNGPAGSLDCSPTGGQLVCDALGARCVDTGSGRTPFGTNPLCSVSGRVTQLGGRPAWGELTANSFYSGLTRVQSATRAAFMTKQGFQLLSGPESFERSYTEVGTNLVVEVLQPSELPADRGSVQAYCSNVDAGVNNVFLGQRELAAGLNTASFTFDSRCWGDGTTGMLVGVSVRTATNQASRAALLGYRFGGTIRAVSNPFGGCGPTPDPAPTVLDPGLLARIANGTMRPGITSGTFLRDVNLGGSMISASLVPLARDVLLR